MTTPDDVLVDGTPFRNDEAEQAVLGGILLDPGMLDAVPHLQAQHLYHPRNQSVLRAVRRTVDGAEGARVDVIAVMERLRLDGDLQRVGGGPYLHELTTACPTTASVPRYAQLVIECAARRDMRRLAAQFMQATEHPDGEVVRDRLADLAVHLGTMIDGDATEDELADLEELGVFVDRVRSVPRRWVIPGVLAPMERVIVVAGEGGGKSTWSRQIAVCVGQGRHPMNPRVRIPKQRVLMVDLENPPDLIASNTRHMVETVSRQAGGWDSEGVWVWPRPGGVNLRKQADVALLDRLMSHVRPDLVCLGPLYKASLNGNDAGEQIAQEVSAALDKLRTKHRCALWLEHHAPMSQNGARELRPVSSGVWMRWPEFGLTLQQDPDDQTGQGFLVGRFRRDRDAGRAFPERMRWSRPWPWESIYDGGMPDVVLEDVVA